MMPTQGKPQVLLSTSTAAPFEITRLSLQIPWLPETFEGYRILQLSDLHYGPLLTLDRLRGALEVANGLDPDLCVLTGDYLQNGTVGLHHYLATQVNPKTFRWMNYRRKIRTLTDELYDAISLITPADGMLGVFGNHDYLEGIGTITRKLKSRIRWLKNTSTTISRGNDSLCISGVDDIRYGKPDLIKTEKSVPRGCFLKLLLCHNPDITLDANSEKIAKFDLMLCGHTHGGQLCLPGRVPIVTQTKQRRHTSGLSYFASSNGAGSPTPVYVSRGVGFGSISLRLFCPPEITLIVLNRAEPAKPAVAPIGRRKR